MQGRIYTGEKLLCGSLIYEKLDRVIFRDDCLQIFPNYIVTNCPFTYSNHSYVYLSTEPTHPRRKGTNSVQQHLWAHYHDTHCQKLDRVIFRDDCLQIFPNYIVMNGPFTYSNHSYVYLNTEPTHPRRKGTNFVQQHLWAHYHDTHCRVKKLENAFV